MYKPCKVNIAITKNISITLNLSKSNPFVFLNSVVLILDKSVVKLLDYLLNDDSLVVIEQNPFQEVKRPDIILACALLFTCSHRL
jgi:hypothetical protein